MKYYFHIQGNKFIDFKPSYIIENESRQVVYEIQTLKLPLLRQGKFKFINHQMLISREYSVSNPITRNNTNRRRIVNSDDNYITIDGKNCWEMFMSDGYGYVGELTGFVPSYIITKNGQNACRVICTGRNVYDETLPIPKIVQTGYCRCECDDEIDLDRLALFCFITSRADPFKTRDNLDNF